MSFPVWKDTPECKVCSKRFTIVRRRSHCRSCGASVCKACSPYRLPIPRLGVTDPVRVCAPCAEQLSAAPAPAPSEEPPRRRRATTVAALQVEEDALRGEAGDSDRDKTAEELVLARVAAAAAAAGSDEHFYDGYAELDADQADEAGYTGYEELSYAAETAATAVVEAFKDPCHGSPSFAAVASAEEEEMREAMHRWETARGLGSAAGLPDPDAAALTSRPLPALDGSGMDMRKFEWNAHYQSVYGTFTVGKAEAAERLDSIRALRDGFVRFAMDVAVAIVDELPLPPERRRIRPASMGGAAGGEKYVYGRVLLKFACDWQGIYGGSDDRAAKAAALEMRANNAVIAAGVDHLHTVLSAIFIVRGRCVVASALAPLSDSSLVYGSGDAARTVMRSSEPVAALVERVAGHYNLAPHVVRDSAGTDHEVAVAVDVEGHRSAKDGRYYLIDTARLLPPCVPRTPARRFKADFLYRHFRPEFCRAYTAARLSSDAFSAFGRVGHEAHHQAVRAAYAHLHGTVVPQLAARMEGFMAAPGSAAAVGGRTPVQLIAAGLGHRLLLSGTVHAAGVNMRYLPHVHRHCRAPELLFLIASQCVIRAVKSVLRRWLRGGARTDAEASAVCARFVALLLDAGGAREAPDAARTFWDTFVVPCVRLKYGRTHKSFMEDVERVRQVAHGALDDAVQRKRRAEAEAEAGAGAGAAPPAAAAAAEKKKTKMGALFGKAVAKAAEVAGRAKDAVASRFGASEEDARRSDFCMMLVLALNVSVPKAVTAALDTGRGAPAALNWLRRAVSHDYAAAPFSLSEAVRCEHSASSAEAARMPFVVGIKWKSASLPPLADQEQNVRLLEEDLELRDKAGGRYNPELLPTLSNLLRAYMSGDHGEAGRGLEKGTAVVERLLEWHRHPEHGPVEQALTNCARFCRHYGQLERALALADEEVTRLEGEARAAAAAGSPAAADAANAELARGLDLQASCAQDAGDKDRAVELFRRAVALAEDAIGLDQDHTANMVNNLAIALQLTGRTAESVPLFERALAVHRANHGEGSTLVLRDRENLATSLRMLGQSERAMQMYREVTAVAEEELGSQHPFTAEVFTRFADFLRAKGRMPEAVTYGRKAVQFLSEAFGERHARTIVGRGHLGFSLAFAGQLQEGAALLQQALREMEAAGEQSTTLDLCTARTDLAQVLVIAAGQQQAAAPVLSAALAEARTLDARMAASGALLQRIALLLKMTGAVAEAGEVAREAIAALLQSTGPEHQHYAAAVGTLATVHDERGEFAEAEPLYREALRTSRQLDGDSAHTTLMATANLGGALSGLGQHDEAVRCYEQALGGMRANGGLSPPDAIAHQENNLAAALVQRAGPGDVQRARGMFLGALRRQEAQVGEKHPNMVPVRLNVVMTLIKAGDFDGSMALMKVNDEVCAGPGMGAAHPYSALALNCHALWFKYQGRWEEALPIYERAVPALNAALGAQHPQTVMTTEVLHEARARVAGTWTEGEDK